MTGRKGIITGQKVAPAKLERAQQLRRQMTPHEKKLWACLRANRLDGFHFRRQQVIDGFLIDFYCHSAGLVLETDGPIHQQQGDYDAERDRWLRARGLRVLRITNAEIDADLPGVLSRVRTACRADQSSPAPVSCHAPHLLERGEQ